MSTARNRYDILVVGAGHAGIEAALAAARIGARTGMVTGNLDTIGKMSCNPAIGGMAKGQLAREVDALGGAMGLATDANGIQFRLLGRSKGPAMWSPRAQCDKAAYATWMKHYVESQDNVWPIHGDVVDLIVDDSEAQPTVQGVRLRDGRELFAAHTVLTTGTFLQGLMHQGETKTAGGRTGDAPATGISGTLHKLGLKLIRQKTGTPMRIHGDSVNWDLCDTQPGDDEPQPFSFLTEKIIQPQIDCYSCYTTPEAHDIIRANLERAPMYNGQIDSVGPRYCPSIEDKVVRFASRDKHHLFLEPEGTHTREVYVNGLSTSLPIDVQDNVLAKIPALENAHVLRYGYAVEYDVVAADQLDHTLRVRSVQGLSLGGQINGTSGYEEAAIQGLMAGANAALALAGKDPLIINRAEGYCGVLIDDLVTRCPDEPYRMFTSRAEHRLHLRHDNADRRLGAAAHQAGLIDDQRKAAIDYKEQAIADTLKLVPADITRRISGEALDFAATAALVPQLNELEPITAQQVWIELRYHSYIERQQDRIDKLERMSHLKLPADLDISSVPSLSNEGRQLLTNRSPRTLGEASMLPGVSRSDIEHLWAFLKARFEDK